MSITNFIYKNVKKKTLSIFLLIFILMCTNIVQTNYIYAATTDMYITDFQYVDFQNDTRSEVTTEAAITFDKSTGSSFTSEDVYTTEGKLPIEGSSVSVTFSLPLCIYPNNNQELGWGGIADTSNPPRFYKVADGVISSADYVQASYTLENDNKTILIKPLSPLDTDAIYVVKAYRVFNCDTSGPKTVNTYLNNNKAGYHSLLYLNTVSSDDIQMEGSGYDAEHPISINSAYDLYNMRNILNWNSKHYVLTQNINMNDLKSEAEAKGETLSLGEDENWTCPEGVFSGTFDGQGFTISNIKQKDYTVISNAGYAGLFQTLGNVGGGAGVKNLNIDSASFAADATNAGSLENLYAGSMAGILNAGASIENCVVKNSELAAVQCGGIVGSENAPQTSLASNITGCSVENATLNLCDTKNALTLRSGAGGLIGWLHNANYNGEYGNNTITNLTINTGDMSNPVNVGMGGIVGGMHNQLGINWHDINVNGITFTGNASGNTRDTAKILVGGAFGSIGADHANNVVVSGVDVSNLLVDDTYSAFYHFGTFAGGTLDSSSNSCAADMNNCYASLSSASSNVKGNFIGYNAADDNYNNSCDTCYYNEVYGMSDSSVQPSGVLGVSLSLEPATEAQTLSTSNRDSDGAGVSIVARTKDKDYIANTIEEGMAYSDLTEEQKAAADAKVTDGGVVVEDFAPITLNWKVAEGSPVNQAVTFTENENSTGAAIKCTYGASGKIWATAIVNGVEVGGGVDENGNAIPIEVDYSYIRSSGGGGGGSSSTTAKPSTDTNTNTNTNTTTNTDGSTTTTQTDEKGTVTQTTTAVNGTQTVVESKTDGSKDASISVPEAAGTAGQETVVSTPVASITLPAELAGKAVDISINVAPAGNSTSGQIGAVTVSVKAGGANVSAPVKIRVNIANILIANSKTPLSGGSAGLPQVTAPEVVAYADGKLIMNAYVSGEELILSDFTGGTVTLMDNSKAYSDVAEGYWGKTGVDFVSARGLFTGVNDSEFAPESPMTRAMLATVLYRLDGQAVAGADAGFGDVVAGSWYADAVNWAAGKAVVSGIGDGKFAPEGMITREQLAVMLYRYNGSKAVNGNLDAFADVSEVSAYAADAMVWAVDNGLISGVGDNKLDPKGNATRAQVATILMRYCQL